MRRFAVLFCLAALAAGGVNATNSSTTQVYLIDGELAYAGELDEQANKRLFALYGSLKAKPGTLSILSQGGPVRAGMALGRWVRAHKLNIKVLEYCLSSCANYVFPAGARKIVSNFAVIGFHGGAESTYAQFTRALQKLTPGQRNLLDGGRQSLQDQAREEPPYLKEIGVRADMVSLGQQDKYRPVFEQDPTLVGWTYSREDFEQLGVHGIEVINPPWRPGSALKEAKFVVLKLYD
jgi:hypothetical protein